jgi:hypothetical protein
MRMGGKGVHIGSGHRISHVALGTRPCITPPLPPPKADRSIVKSSLQGAGLRPGNSKLRERRRRGIRPLVVSQEVCQHLCPAGALHPLHRTCGCIHGRSAPRRGFRGLPCPPMAPFIDSDECQGACWDGAGAECRCSGSKRGRRCGYRRRLRHACWRCPFQAYVLLARLVRQASSPFWCRFASDSHL